MKTILNKVFIEGLLFIVFIFPVVKCGQDFMYKDEYTTDYDDLNKINELCNDDGHSCDHDTDPLHPIKKHNNNHHRHHKTHRPNVIEYDDDKNDGYEEHYYEISDDYAHYRTDKHHIIHESHESHESHEYDNCNYCLIYGENKVCGDNGIEYTNQCLAQCNGINICTNNCPCHHELRVGQMLNSAIRNADEEEATRLFRDHENIKDLVEGITYDPNEKEKYLTKSKDRSKDPDVVAYNSIINAIDQSKITDHNLEFYIAHYANECCTDLFWTVKLPLLIKNKPFKPNVLKLARVIAESYIPEDGIFPPGESLCKIMENIVSEFLYLELTKKTQEFIDNHYHQVMSTGSRKLSVSSGVSANSLICAFCWPRRYCRKTAWWCKY